MGSITGQRIDYLGVQRGQQHLLEKKLTQVPHPQGRLLRFTKKIGLREWGSPTVSRDAILVGNIQNGVT